MSHSQAVNIPPATLRAVFHEVIGDMETSVRCSFPARRLWRAKDRQLHKKWLARLAEYRRILAALGGPPREIGCSDELGDHVLREQRRFERKAKAHPEPPAYTPADARQTVMSFEDVIRGVTAADEGCESYLLTSNINECRQLMWHLIRNQADPMPRTLAESLDRWWDAAQGVDEDGKGYLAFVNAGKRVCRILAPDNVLAFRKAIYETKLEYEAQERASRPAEKVYEKRKKAEEKAKAGAEAKERASFGLEEIDFRHLMLGNRKQKREQLDVVGQNARALISFADGVKPGSEEIAELLAELRATAELAIRRMDCAKRFTPMPGLLGKEYERTLDPWDALQDAQKVARYIRERMTGQSPAAAA